LFRWYALLKGEPSPWNTSSRESPMAAPTIILWLFGFILKSSMYACPALIGAVESVRRALG
jgi:hypothetical protein